MTVNIIGTWGLKIKNLLSFLPKFFTNDISHKVWVGVLAGEEFKLGGSLADEH